MLRLIPRRWRFDPHVLYFRTGGPQGGLCKTFPLSIRIPGTARFEDVRCATGAYSEKFYFGRDEAPRCPKHTLKLVCHVGDLGAWRVSQASEVRLRIRWNAAKRSGLSWGDSSIPCGIYIMPRRRRDAMGMRKLKIKKVLKNTFYRKSNGNLISQLKILIQNQAVFETSSTNNFFSRIAYCHTPTFSNAQERQLSNDVGV